MPPEQRPQPGLRQRPSGCRATEHHEALWGGQATRALSSQVGAELGEEHAIDGDYAFLAALANDPEPPTSHVDVPEQQSADLCGTQPTEQHQEHDGSVTVGPQVGQEHVDVGRWQ